MGLINTSHKEVLQSLTNFQADLVKNPYSLFNDKKASIVDYYNLNVEMSTLDQALKTNYANLGADSPLRFNVIYDFYLYGLDRISASLENGEFGMEAGDISGDAIVLPNTITPYPGDYFSITIIKSQPFLFKVTSVSMDTFDDGNNYWRIEYTLDQRDTSRLDPLLMNEYEFCTGNIGTKFNPIVQKTRYDFAKKLDDKCSELKRFYKALYFNDKVQTFTYVYLYQVCQTNMHSAYFYDPYMMEFIIKNDVLASDGDKYLYISHKTTLESLFPIKYSKSIWRVLENKELDNTGSCIISSYAKYIDDPATIFQTRFENYFELTYENYASIEGNAPTVVILPQQVIGHIDENQLFDYNSDQYAKYNIIIKYMHDTPLSMDDLNEYDKIQACDMTEENYFTIPMAIFCMEQYIKKLITKTS